MNIDTRQFSKEPSFNESGLGNPIARYTSPLISNKGESWVVFGTCIFIAPGLAITAKHVIEDLLRTYDSITIGNDPTLDQEFLVTHNSCAFQIVDGTKAYRWNVKQYFFSPVSDLCFLSLEPMFDLKDYPLNQKITMTIIPPPVGERIAAFGFPKSSVSVKDDVITTEVAPKTTIGEVVEVHQTHRDQRLHFPVFRTNARFDAGMSGGPVFNNSGRLIGVICSSMEPFENDQDYVSYVTLLWPGMATRIWFNLAHHDLTERFPVVFLAEHKYIAVEGWEKFEMDGKGKIGLRIDN